MKERIVELLKENVDELANVNITDDTKLISSGYLESFDVISLLTVMEEEFDVNISLDDVDFEDFDTVPKISALLEEARKSA